MEQSLHLISDVLDRLFAYGPIWIYLALFAALFIENIFPPFPGDFVTITGGAMAATGRLNVFLVFLAVYLGGISSVMLVYYFGYTKGREFFIRKNYRFFSAGDIDRLEAWFRRRGAWLLLANRFTIGARAVVNLVAGIGQYDPVKMFVFNSISFWVFNSLLLFSSYIFVVEFDVIARYFHLYEKVVWPTLILVVIGIIIYKVYRVRRNGK